MPQTITLEIKSEKRNSIRKLITKKEYINRALAPILSISALKAATQLSKSRRVTASVVMISGNEEKSLSDGIQLITAERAIESAFWIREAITRHEKRGTVFPRKVHPRITFEYASFLSIKDLFLLHPILNVT